MADWGSGRVDAPASLDSSVPEPDSLSQVFYKPDAPASACIS